jgi:hypothetical protein
MNVLDVNTVNQRNLYPAALGVTVGQQAGANNQAAIGGVQNATPSAGDSAEVSRAVSIGGQASPAIGALVFIGLIVGLAFLARKIGEETEFRNVRVSPFNVMIISLAAIIGVPVWKYAFTKFPIPGVSTWVQSV